MGEAAIEVAEQQGSSNNPASANLPAEPGAAMPGSQLPPPPRVAIQLIEDELRSDLEKIPQEARVPMLLRALADTRIRAGHEFVYNRIFGSQISALKALNERGPIPDHDAMREFEPLKTQFPEVYGKYEFGDWAGWLERMSMVTHQNGVYAITPLGRDFLFYLVDTGLTENKPL
ncbi:hypothetical protein EHI47_14535 [Rhizobium leguminosarum]|uniref:Uncharacterized protein n=1 Tax=Rhizobium leguminosarum TaxID=384 RepID=A0A444I0X0_RHILE|nr:hypothetical protein [Rhizobium leguminosarum]RWX30664.1 hypothetical protein EHI47_14535 [Rhizobium leguminosarum]